MKKKFSTAWKASKQPRKQRKYVANAPLNVKRRFMSVNLSKELRKARGRRSMVLRKGDTVIVKKGKFKGKRGKVLSLNIKKMKVEVEGMQVGKQDGSKINVKLIPTKLQIIELNRRKKNVVGKATKEEKKEESSKSPEKEKKQGKTPEKAKKEVAKNAS